MQCFSFKLVTSSRVCMHVYSQYYRGCCRFERGEGVGVPLKERMVESCIKVKAPLVAEVAQRVSWSKVWDACMDLGIGCTRGIQVRVMCHHGRGSRPCPLCDCSSVSQDSLLGHLLMQRRESLGLAQACSVEDVVSSVAALQLMKFIRFKSLFQNTFR